MDLLRLRTKKKKIFERDISKPYTESYDGTVLLQQHGANYGVLEEVVVPFFLVLMREAPCVTDEKRKN